MSVCYINPSFPPPTSLKQKVILTGDSLGEVDQPPLSMSSELVFADAANFLRKFEAESAYFSSGPAEPVKLYTCNTYAYTIKNY